MKVKGPPPPQTPTKAPEIKKTSNMVASTLAGLAGANETESKKVRKQAMSEAEKRKQLKAFGLKCGVRSGDSPKEATEKLVRGVLDDEYDSKERGFNQMVEEICDYIQEQNVELKDKFALWIQEIQKESE